MFEQHVMIYFVDRNIAHEVRQPMDRPQLRPINATALALAVFGLLESATILFGGNTQLKELSLGPVNMFAVATGFVDWVACIACVLIGMKFSESKPVVVGSCLATVLAIWHLGMIFYLFNLAQVLEDTIVPYTVVYFGGLLITGAVLVLCYERRTLKGTLAHRRALAELGKQSVYGEALNAAGLGAVFNQNTGEVTYFGGKAEDGKNAFGQPQTKLPRNFELSEAEERSASFFDLDLILLEDQLLKIKPNRNSYISALRLGLAIEKDLGFVNCRARSSTFAELMRDVCMRLSVTLGDDMQWLSLAEGFRHYGQDDRLVRRKKIGFCEEMLAATQFEALKNSQDNDPDNTRDGKILATIN